jgi:hypothetical protein
MYKTVHYTYLDAQTYQMSYLLALIGKKIYTRTLFCTEIDIKSMLLQNCHNHNLITRGFDKVNSIDYSDISP